MASGSTAPFSGEFVDLENVPKLPEGISAEQIFEQNADAIRQTAEARHAAGLAQVNADGGFFDIYADKTKVSSSSNVSFTTGANGKASLVSGVALQDGLEDGSSELNFESNSNISIDTNGEINGSNSLRINSSNQVVIQNNDLSGQLDSDGQKFRFKTKIDNQGSNSSDNVTFQLQDSSGNAITNIRFFPGGNIEELESSTVLKNSWSANTIYEFVITYDFTNQSYDITLNGTTTSGIAFPVSSSNIDGLKLVNLTDNAGITRNAFLDDYTFTGDGTASNGTVTQKQFTFTDSTGTAFTPSKVGIFADVDTSGSGESVSFELVNSSGTTVKTFQESDLNQLISVSVSNNTFSVEANLTGNGSSTPEVNFLDVRGV
jgi:hypothetical protein